MKKTSTKNLKIIGLSSLLLTHSLYANESEDMAKKLANPIAAIITLPIEANYGKDLGSGETGSRWIVNLQPLVPFDLNEDWSLITRTIIPLTSYDTGSKGIETQSGTGDILLSAWVSPKELTDNGWIWGVGVGTLIPTNSEFSAKKWGLGPTAIVLKQEGPWTYGGLANHIWSTGGSDSVVENISTTFLQPFVSYVTPEAIEIGVNTEIEYDWESEEFSIPFNLQVTKLTKIGNQLVSYGGGVTYWAESTDNDPKGWGARVILTFIFPK